jgi:hypothetical protein
MGPAGTETGAAPLWWQFQSSNERKAKPMITQLNPPLPLATAKGPGMAHFVIDYGPEADLMWVVFMDKDGACWSVPNPEVRMQFNWSLGRRNPESKPGDLAAEAEMEPARAGANVHRVFPRPAE